MDNNEAASLREQLETLMVAFNSSYDGLHILDGNGYTVLINNACQRIEGTSAEDIGHKNIRELVEEGYYSESVTLKVLEQKMPVTIIQKVRNGNTVLVTGTPIFKDGRIDKVVVNSRDITELNALKDALSEKRLELEKYQEEWEKLRAKVSITSNMVCNSLSMKKIIETALIVSKVDSTVLICGESGSGKGMLSRLIHDNSARKDRPFVKIDCGSIPDTLFESEIFGYEKGAFTGANSGGKMGLAQLADGGTLFLDEIGEVPLLVQTKLLRLVQNKEILRVGGENPIKVNVRIIAATNRDLLTMVNEGKFRLDLYYRLNVIPIEIPPLRERKDDIYGLIINTIDKINKEYEFHKKISSEAMDILIDYSWPGNVRELENIMERIMILADGEMIGIDDLPAFLKKANPYYEPEGPDSLKSRMEYYEKEILKDLLLKKMPYSEISQSLDIDITTLRRKLHKYKLI